MTNLQSFILFLSLLSTSSFAHEIQEYDKREGFKNKYKNCKILNDASYSTEIIGKHVSSKFMKSVFRCLGTGTVLRLDDNVYFSYHKYGIEIAIENSTNLITAIFFNNNQNSGFYPGDLPLGMTFDDNQSTLWSIFGLPTKEYIVEKDNLFVVTSEMYDFSGLSLSVDYGTLKKDSKYYGKKIFHIGLMKINPTF